MWLRWSLDPWLIGGVAIAALLYARGVRGLAGRVRGFPRRRVAAFAAAIALLIVALASPIDAIGHLLLWVHMVQHWLLIMVVAPLLLIASPGLPVLRGLPATLRRGVCGPFLASPGVRRAFTALVHPASGWIALSLSMWIWHIPALYQLALESGWVHRVEHASFLAAGILFWWPIVSPWPWRRRWPAIALVAYVLTADLQGTLFAALLCFADAPIYASYESTSPALGLSALRDQRIAGAFMWMASQAILLPVAGALALTAVGRARRDRAPLAARPERPRLRARAEQHFDLLRVRGIGSVLRSRAAREWLRWVLLVFAAAVAVDGFIGPSDAPRNLAGTHPWTHWRGIVVVLLLVSANVACMTCPLIAPRRLLRRFISPPFAFPRPLRNKWLAATLVVAWLVSYEAFDFWASPLATAWIIVGYFVAAFLVDTLFAGGSFCKWVCPIGQLHMSLSLVAPLSVAVRSTKTCDSCTTHECIRGAKLTVNGCDLELFQPRKRGNQDCTFCLDCADACPHSNVGILPQQIRRGLLDPSWGSSIGQIARRVDIAALLAVLTGGAFANALAMTGPWLALADALAVRGWTLWIAEASLALAALAALAFVLPAFAAVFAARRSPQGFVEAFAQGVHACVPIGAAMWAAHWLFHLGTSASTALPVVQRAAQDLGLSLLGEPEWSASCCGPVPSWLQPIQLLLLQGGFLVSAWIAFRAFGARRAYSWWAVLLILLSLGMWIVLQPMQMRGTAMP